MLPNVALTDLVTDAFRLPPTCDERLGRDLAVSVALGKATWAQQRGRVRGTAICGSCGGRFCYEGRVGHKTYLIHDSHCTCGEER